MEKLLLEEVVKTLVVRGYLPNPESLPFLNEIIQGAYEDEKNNYREIAARCQERAFAEFSGSFEPAELVKYISPDVLADTVALHIADLSTEIKDILKPGKLYIDIATGEEFLIDDSILEFFLRENGITRTKLLRRISGKNISLSELNEIYKILSKEAAYPVE